MIYWIFAIIAILVFLFVVYALCKIAAAADKAEEYIDNL